MIKSAFWREAKLSCDICQDNGRDEQLIYCNGCNIGVHASCYGVAYYDSSWMCQRCDWDAPSDVSCCLCPDQLGAMVESGSKWYHVTCIDYHSQTWLDDDLQVQGQIN